MAPSSSDADGTIEALLQQRAQYEQWLSRLDATAETAPTAVRERVRSDYEARLRGVIDELRGHAATIHQELEHHRAAQSRLDTERQKAEEALAEAEVRHAVGEYGDDEWQRLSDQSQHYLEGLRGELQTVGAEIARLAEVQSVIGGAPPRPSARPAPVEVPVPSLVASPSPSPVPTPVAVTPPAPAPVSPMRSPEPLAAAPAIDELAFLKSVSDEDRTPAAAPRRSGAPPTATATKQVEPAPVAAPLATPAPMMTPAPASPQVATPVAAPVVSGAGKTAGMAKTLKCNECGTLNRPTEWYCERCGAELAAL